MALLRSDIYGEPTEVSLQEGAKPERRSPSSSSGPGTVHCVSHLPPCFLLPKAPRGSNYQTRGPDEKTDKLKKSLRRLLA